MSEQTWSFSDKKAWKRGEWDREPDKIQWVDEATGLDCLIHRNRSGALCGYVGVPEGHRYFGVGYSACPEKCGEDWCGHSPGAILDVHGGLTYADFCQESDEKTGRGICHIAEPGRPDKVWWLGFDCAHLHDVVPGYARSHESFETSYRNVWYVKNECARLAEQLAKP